MLLINDLSRQTASLRPLINDAIQRVLDRGWFINGPELEAFESEFARYLAHAGPVHPLIPPPPVHCVGVANGTDALELALRAIGIGPGHRVATVAVAGMYATTAILACGATPVYLDIVPNSTHMDLDALRTVAPTLDAVVATHLYGRMEPMPDVLNAAGAVPVIEDCAQAHGARLRNRAAGRWGTLAAFSFYPTKNLGALGDGGAVVTDNPGLAAKLRALRQYGWTAKYASTVSQGRNSRLDEIQAAVLRLKLPCLDAWNERRRTIARAYGANPTETDVVHLYTLRHPRRDALREALKSRGIPTEIHYPTPDYRQPSVNAAIAPLPESDRHCAETLTLPCFPEMTDDEVFETSTALAESLS